MNLFTIYVSDLERRAPTETEHREHRVCVTVYNEVTICCIVVECKACFMKSKYKVDEEIVLMVYIKCISQFSLRFSELEVIFNDEVSLF